MVFLVGCQVTSDGVVFGGQVTSDGVFGWVSGDQ